MSSKDPLACVHAYDIAAKLILPTLYGLRMCPDCPNCALAEKPCMDMFGSNATPMGGGMGRADAVIGATEAQKAEGVLHMHFFIFLQMAHQFSSLEEIATKFREHMMSIDSLKRFHDYVRCATYPNLDEFLQKRDAIEKAWPAFAKDQVLSRAPTYAWEALRYDCAQVLHKGADMKAWEDDGRRWLTLRNDRLQHVLSHMNHHIHPLKDDGSGKRRLLTGCRSKANP